MAGLLKVLSVTWIVQFFGTFIVILVGFSICIFDSAKHAKTVREKEKEKRNNKGIEGIELVNIAVEMKERNSSIDSKNIEVVNPMPVSKRRAATWGSGSGSSSGSASVAIEIKQDKPNEEKSKKVTKEKKQMKIKKKEGPKENVPVLKEAHRVKEEEDDDKRSTRLRNEKRYRQLALDSDQPAVLGWIELAGPPVVYCNVETGDIMYKKPKDWVKSMRNVFESGGVSNVSLKKRKAHHHRARTK